MKFVPLVLGACTLVLAGSPAAAQTPSTKSSSASPCCSITAIDLARNLVTARDASGKTFQFNARDAALLKTLRVGQAVSADFGSGRVRIHGAEPCCAIVGTAAPVGAKPAEPGQNVQNQMNPLEPCCGITAINTATGIATARVLATGAAFSFQVKDAALLKSLTIGQKVNVNFTTGKVRIHGSEPCCSIIP